MKISRHIIILSALFIVLIFMSACLDSRIDRQVKEDNPVIKNTPLIISIPNSDTEYSLSERAEVLVQLDLIDKNEYPPSKVVTRSMAVKMIIDLLGKNQEAQNGDYTHPFIDISDDINKYLGYLYQNNIIYGITFNKFEENEICDVETYIIFVLKALNYSDEKNGDFTDDTAMDFAKQIGLISNTYELENDDIFLGEDMLEISSRALTQVINGSDILLLTKLLNDKAVDELKVNAFWEDAYKISGSSYNEPFFTENFDDKEFSYYNVTNSFKKAYWKSEKVRGTDNQITDDGYLMIAGLGQDLARQQTLALDKDFMQGYENYGMTFTINVEQMGNEGSEKRSLFTVIPRTKDKDMESFYAINYYMVIPMKEYVSNLARCKWSIVNTNAPSGTSPLAEGYFLLKEDVDYRARLLIENTPDNNVNIKFYIDGPDHFTEQYEPLLEYTDTSEYKILESATGPAFGISGYGDEEWGIASAVKFDDVKLYDVDSFKAQTNDIKEYTNTEIVIEENDNLKKHIRYLTNIGVIKPYINTELYSNHKVSAAEFMASILYLEGIHLTDEDELTNFTKTALDKIFEETTYEKNEDLTRMITRYEAAIILSKRLKGIRPSRRYYSLIADETPNESEFAVNFAVQNSYLKLDSDNKFNGDDNINRNELIEILARCVNPSYRKTNFKLRMPDIITDDAIFQRDKPIPISGLGMSGDVVTVEFKNQKKITTVVDGHWYVELDSEPYGGPYTLTIKDSAYYIIKERIYVGEVFVVAGQSNAEMTVYECNENEDVLQRFSGSSRLRIYRQNITRAVSPRYSNEGKWSLPVGLWNEWMIGETSAMGVFFVDELLRINPEIKDMKIGIIQITYGGTSIELFMPDSVNEKNNFIQKDNEFIMSGFWNGYMDAVTPYAVKALMYYQGENSAQLEYIYEPMLRDYIWGVRKEFNDPDLPVMLVQISGYGDNYTGDSSSWAKIREIQMRVANTTPNVGVVTTIDLADENPYEIHPKDKKPIGKRLANLAMNLIYDNPLTYKSPIMVSAEAEGNFYRVFFDEDDLHLIDSADMGFDILDENGQWGAAQAEIDEISLKVWNQNIAKPTGVRYAWHNYPGISLFNKYDLPVFPFNTTKDLFAGKYNSDFTTTETLLRKSYHLLGFGDAVINISRQNQFRLIVPVNAYMVEYVNGITNQATGDIIIKLEKQENAICEKGTTSNLIVINNHGLKVHDWIRNIKYDYAVEVLEVIDIDTIRVSEVEDLLDGNIFEIYHNAGVIIAE